MIRRTHSQFLHRIRSMAGALLVMLLVAVQVVCLGGCAGPAANTTGKLEGTVRVSGAWALYPMMVRWAEEFQKVYPDVKIDVSAGGAGKGMTDALGEMVELGMISRGIKDEEIQQGAVFVPVVKDTVMAIISADNPVAKELQEKGIKKSVFVDLWINGRAMTWGEVVGGSSTDTVQVYTRSDSCGAAEIWAKYLGGVQEDLKGTGVYGDPGIADAVKGDKLGIGYSNLNYAFDLSSGKPVAGLIAVPIDVNENGTIDADEKVTTQAEVIQSILAGVYPSPPSRDLYLVTKTEFKGLAREFVRWILTDGQKYVEESGYIKLTSDKIDAALEKLGN